MGDIQQAVPVALLVLGGLLWKGSTNVPSRVQYNKPTTTWPILYVLAAGALGLVVLVVAASGGAPGALAVVGGGVAVFLVARAGASVAGTRVVYDRGGRVMAPGDVVFSLVVASIFLVALAR